MADAARNRDTPPPVLRARTAAGQTAGGSGTVTQLTSAGNRSATTTAERQGESAQLKNRFAMAEQVLALEAQMRSLKSRVELRYLAANEFHKLTGASQIIVHEPPQGIGVGKIAAVKGLAVPDPDAPMLRWLQGEIEEGFRLSRSRVGIQTHAGLNTEESEVHQFRLNGGEAPGGAFATPCALVIPLIDPLKSTSLGAVSFLTKRTLDPDSVRLAHRLCSTLSHALSRFERNRMFRGTYGIKPLALTALLLAAVAMLVPVSMTVLAPASIVPVEPRVIAAPLSGVIESVAVKPNERVREGDLLFSFNQTRWQNEFDLAAKEVAVAEARFKRANQDAFSAGEGRRELAIAKSEMALAITKRRAARRRLGMAAVHAPASGIILFDSREKWTGKPVSTGERVMRISDARQLQIAVELSAGDNIELPKDAAVRLFLDSDPLNPITARLVRRSYEADLSADNRMIFNLVAIPLPEDAQTVRLGQRGTAQLYGDSVPLWFYLFRKPIAYLRQTFGL